MDQTGSVKKSILQVQTLLPEACARVIGHGQKKNQNRVIKTYRASFTIEAAIALSLFIFACVVMMVPMLVFDQHRNISNVLEEQGKLLCKYKYIEYCQAQEKGLEISKEVLEGFETGLSSALILAKISRAGMEDIDVFSETEVNSEMVQYVVNYRAVLPFRLLGLGSVPQQVVSSRRAWIGADGERWKKDEEAGGDETDIIVYVGITSVRYHLDAMCSYLKHNFYTTSGAEIINLRTQSGGRYSPCAACKPNTSMQVVYYTDNGRAYHGRLDCTAMKSYVQPRRLSEVAYMGACSRCGA